MGNKLLHSNWGDDSKSYTAEEIAEAEARFRRRDRVFIFVFIAVILCVSLIASSLLHHFYPNTPCTQIGEYTCIPQQDAK